MNIYKRTKVNQIEITESGVVQVRIALQIIEGGNVVSNKWHRTAISPDGDVDAQMAAVNVHLNQMNEQPVSAEDIAKVKAHFDLANK